MIIRNYTLADNNQIVELFFHTVHSVNAKDYNAEQLNVWAPLGIDVPSWCSAFVTDYTIVADDNGTVIGFANIDNSSHLDRLYVHKDYQGKGVAKQLMRNIETYALASSFKEITADVSITAKSFFEGQGFFVEKENIVARSGQHLLNYKMKKIL